MVTVETDITAYQQIKQAKRELQEFLNSYGDFTEYNLEFKSTPIWYLFRIVSQCFGMGSLQSYKEGEPRLWTEMDKYCFHSQFPYYPFGRPVACLASDEKTKEELLNKRQKMIDTLLDTLSQVISSCLEDISETEKELSQIASRGAETYQRERKALETKVVTLTNKLFTSTQKQIEPFLEGEKVQWFINRENIPQTSGVYILCEKGNIIYIGESEMMRRRLAPSHHIYNPDKHFIGVIVTKNRKGLEARLIKNLHPPLNVKGTISKYQVALL